jgi:CheY-like chemotaxis protein
VHRHPYNNYRTVIIMKLFLIDDEQVVNFITKRLLSQLTNDIEVVDFTDSQKALEQLQVETPDIVFLDLHMPKINGWEFLEEMKHLGLQHKVVILSSSVSAVDQERAADYPNVVEFIEKPVDKEDLKRCLNL